MKDYLKLWGFREEHYSLGLKDIGITDTQQDFLVKYIDTGYPDHGLVFLAPPSKSIKLVSILVKLLYDKGRFKNRVSLIDIPTYVSKSYSLEFSDKSALENKTSEDLVNSDLVIFQELGLTKWTSAQNTRLYTLLYERYERGLPMFATHYGTSDGLEENIGAPNFFRIADTCKFIEIKEKE